MNICYLRKAFLAAVFPLFFSSTSFSFDTFSENNAIIDQFQIQLKQQLMAAIKEGGPSNAVEVCAVEAPSITAKLSAENGVLLQRVSTKNRNRGNKPSSEDKEILKYFESKADTAHVFYSEQGKDTSIYARVIRTDGVCLACHGESISKDVKAALQQYYPNDLATGYGLGDIRGMFTIKRASNEKSTVGVTNFKILNNNLWVGGQPSVEQLEKLKSLGVKTIVNLRPQSEMPFDEAALAKRLGLAYSTIPVGGADDITFQNSRRLQSTLSQAVGPVFLHCSSANRAGALLALAANDDGKSLEASLEAGRMAGLESLDKTVSTVIKAEQTSKK